MEDLNTEYIDKDDINIKVVKYNVKSLLDDIDINSNDNIGDDLSRCLDKKYYKDKYRRNCEKILEDLKVFYKDLDYNDLSKDRISWIYRNIFINTYDINLLLIFNNKL